MKKIFLLLTLPLLSLSLHAQQIYISRNATLSFFSTTVVEDIEGKSTTANSVLDIKSGNILVKVSNTSFQFKKKLMQEHFNENYMESEKYPYSVFNGKITDEVDLNKEGSYTVNVSGILSIHGVDKTYQSKAVITVEKGKITAKTVFKVKIEDHQIKVPSLVFKNIAEYVEVRVSAVYQPKN